MWAHISPAYRMSGVRALASGVSPWEGEHDKQTVFFCLGTNSQEPTLQAWWQLLSSTHHQGVTVNSTEMDDCGWASANKNRADIALSPQFADS